MFSSCCQFEHIWCSMCALLQLSTGQMWAQSGHKGLQVSVRGRGMTRPSLTSPFAPNFFPRGLEKTPPHGGRWEKMRGSGVKKVKQWRKKVEGSKVLVGVTLEEGATRNQPRVAVVDHQRLVHVVAHLLLNLKVGQVKHQEYFKTKYISCSHFCLSPSAPTRQVYHRLFMSTCPSICQPNVTFRPFRTNHNL